MEISQLYRIFRNSTGVCTDTRAIIKGSVFFALKGATFNGNEFVQQALGQGAAYAVADEVLPVKDARVITVEDTLSTLQQLALFHRRQLKSTIIGITGTNGKTTTKELIHAVLSAHYNCRATKGNLNNHIGVPLTLLSFTGEEEYGVIEMGANHPGEIAELSRICEPDYGIITNVGKAHLEGFGSFEKIIRTKLGLFDNVFERDGLAFINYGNDILKNHPISRRVYYGTDEAADLSGALYPEGPFVSIRANFNEGTSDIHTRLIGGYNFENILAACCIGEYFKVPAAKIKAALENYVPSNNRSEYRKTASNELFLDAYNANPSSMEKAIENFAGLKTQAKLVILGDMFELGPNSEEYHRQVISKVSALELPAIFVGKEFFRVKQEGTGEYYESVAELAENLKKNPVSGKTILIKGSRGIKLEQLVEHL